MSTSYYWKVYCFTENAWVYTESPNMPTVCPNNAGHSINSGLTSIDLTHTDTVTTDGSQTISNKTLVNPVITTITNGGTITMPTSTTTLIGNDTSDILTNKTINSANNNITLSASTITSGILPVSVGGTGASSLTQDGWLKGNGTSAITSVKNNMNASIPPNNTTDDITLGYDVGSRWFDTTANKEYVCLNATDGAAVWNLTTGGITSINALTPTTQLFATGATGSDFNIASSGATHTFNMPNASLTTTGTITNAAQSLMGPKLITAPAPTIAFVGNTVNAGTNTSSLTLNVPTGTNAINMQMVAFITVRNGHRDLGNTTPYTDTRAIATPPVGWTLVSTQDNVTNYPRTVFIYLRTVVPPEPVSYTWAGISPSPAQSLTATFTATFSGTTMTVTAISAGTITTGQTITGGAIPANTTITAFGTGSGSTGTYTISNSYTAAGIATSATVPKTNFICGGITTFSSAATYSAINAIATVNNAVSNSFTTPSITTTVPNTLVLAYASFASVSTAWTIPGSLTQAGIIGTGLSGPSPPAGLQEIGESMVIAYKFQATATTVGPYTLTSNGSFPDAGITVLLALKQTSSAILTLQAGVTQGTDLYDNVDSNGNILSGFNAAGNLFIGGSASNVFTETLVTPTLTANRVITIPDATDTVALLSTVQSFTNKTLTDNTNNVVARGLWDGSGTGSVSVYAATAPTTGQVLTATSGTVATWQTPAVASDITTLNTLTAAVQTFATGTTGSDFNISSATSTHTFNFPDASLTARGLVTTGAQTFGGAKTLLNPIIADTTTNTKKVAFLLTGATAATTLTIADQQTTSQTLSIPNLNAADEMMTTGSAQNVTGTKQLLSISELFCNNTQTYAVGTASQTTTTITGVGTTFTTAMVGGVIIYSGGSKAFITGFTNTTTLTSSASQTVTPTQAYTIYYGCFQKDSTGSLSIKRLNISGLTASLPVQTDANDNLTSAAIALGGSQVTGTLTVPNGGTGAITLTSGNFVQANGTGAFTATKVIPSGVVVGDTDAQTLTNKIATSNTNNLLARGLWNGSGADNVSTYAATAPTTGQALIASSATTATWQNLSALTWRGVWSNSTTYANNDIVSLSGSAYICILGHTNQVPPNATYWNVITVTAPGGSTTQVQYNNSGVLAGTANLIIDTDTYPIIGDDVGAAPTVPTSGVKIYSKFRAGRHMLAQVGPSGMEYGMQPSLFANKIAWYTAQGNSNSAVTSINFTLSNTGTLTARNVATTNLFTSMRRMGFVSSVPAGSSAGTRHSAQQYWMGNAAGLGGFFFVARFGLSSASTVANQRSFVGLIASTAVLGNANPSTNTNILGFGVDSADSTWTFMHNAASTTTKDALTGTFPARDLSVSMFEARIFCPPNGTTIYYSLEVLGGGSLYEGSTNTNIPANTTLLCPQLWTNNGATVSACGIDISSIYIETDN